MPTLLTDPEQVEQTNEFRTLTTSGMGMVQRRNLYPSGRKHRTRWRISWEMATAEERDTLIDFIRDVNGGGSFTWTPPGGSSGTYRLIDPSTSVTFKSDASHQIELLIEEV